MFKLLYLLYSGRPGMYVRLSIFLISFFTCLSLLAQEYNFKSYSLEEGLSNSNVYSLLQDQRGYLWIGTGGGGVNRFDGLNFEVFDSKNGLIGNDVRALLEDKSGRIWIGTDGGVTVYDGKQFVNLTDSHGVVGSTVLCFYEDETGTVWAGTDDGGLNRIKFMPGKEPQVKVFTQKEGLSSNFIFDIQPDRTGRLWLATLYGGVNILELEGDSIRAKWLRGGIDIPSDLILSAGTDSLGDLWFGTYDAGAFKLVLNGSDSGAVINFNEASGLQDNRIWDVYPDREGRIWMGTNSRGVSKFEKADFTLYTEQNGLPNNQVLCVLEDFEGNIWVGTNGNGLSRFSGDHFSHYTEKTGFNSTQVYDIEQDGKGDYWFASYGGGLTHLQYQLGDPIFKTYKKENGLPGNSVSAVSSSPSGDIWIATENGIGVLGQGKIVRFGEEDGLVNNVVNTILVDRAGVAWCGTKFGVSAFNGDAFFNLTTEQGLIDNTVNHIIEDAEGNIWMGTQGGLVRYDRQTMTTFDEVEGLFHKKINSLAEDPSGNIWIATNGGGIYKFDVHSNDSIPIRFVIDDQLLSSNSVNSLEFVDGRTLLAGSNKGFDKILFNEDGTVASVRNYNKSDGFTGVETNSNSIFRDREGTIWFGTPKGVTRYEPQLERQNGYPPKIHIGSIKLFFKEVDWSTMADSIEPWFGLPNALELSHRSKQLTFSFSGISLSNPEKISYRYMLEGVDAEWSPPRSDNEVTYPGLSPGEYSFQVICINGNGVSSSAPATFNFVIHPPWYQTVWFYLACVIVLAISIYVFIKIRERSLKQEKEHLEKVVAERTREVVEKKEEIEAQNETLEQANLEILEQKDVIEEKNKDITDSINYARKIQEAILPQQDEIKELFPESLVMFWPKDIVSGDFYWMSKRGNKMLFTAADCTGHGVPGAFMSMIGAALLNESVNEKGITSPSEILFEVRKGIIASLKQTGGSGQQNDGMDMALCMIDKEDWILEYAGANNSVYILRKKGVALQDDEGNNIECNMETEDVCLFEIKASKQPVGYYTGEEKPYANHRIRLQKGDTIFSFSDGFPDQFGGPKGKKYKYATFKRLLLSIFHQSMEEQHEILNQTMIEWMGDLEQVDDICVVGVRY